jgi:hypothetical protein
VKAAGDFSMGSVTLMAPLVACGPTGQQQDRGDDAGSAWW